MQKQLLAAWEGQLGEHLLGWFWRLFRRLRPEALLNLWCLSNERMKSVVGNKRVNRKVKEV